MINDLCKCGHEEIEHDEVEEPGKGVTNPCMKCECKRLDAKYQRI